MEKLNNNLYRLNKNQYLLKTKKKLYRIINPFAPYNKEKEAFDLTDTKNYNWFNLLTGGSWSRLFLLILILSLVWFTAWGYKYEINQCKQLIEDNQPITIEFKDWDTQKGEMQGGYKPNLSLLTQDNVEVLNK